LKGLIGQLGPVAALFGALVVAPLPGAVAQLSPNCERNGRRDYCAITPVSGATNEQQSFDMITFADHTVYEVTRSLASCKMISEKIETCNAKIITPPGSSRVVPAFYRRTFYEGGVKQEYVGKGIHLTYVYLD
jgi:hypothetical protein